MEAAAELRELAGEGLAAVGGASPGGGALSDGFRRALPTLLGCLVRGAGLKGEGAGLKWRGVAKGGGAKNGAGLRDVWGGRLGGGVPMGSLCGFIWGSVVPYRAL